MRRAQRHAVRLIPDPHESDLREQSLASFLVVLALGLIVLAGLIAGYLILGPYV